ncbi:MAG TPA: methyl-accepting chemotaxis protein, partial [Gemmatimonadales bacterium]|nr:methyl-accepting chemotaxis protein [Gemmatimonadales bacterium]
LTGMSDLRQRVEEISQKIVQLNERTLQIGGITQTVKDLADQSNMLALNAAIEAVRSGEHGKGFAVVAREIRSLADQSIKATDRVREILEDISTAIRSAVQSTEKGAVRMEAGLVQVRTSGENLRELSNIVKDNSAAVRQIAAAVNQQNAGITQIFTAVTDLSRMMEESIARLGSTTDAAVTLREVANRVQQMVKSYRV